MLSFMKTAVIWCLITAIAFSKTASKAESPPKRKLVEGQSHRGNDRQSSSMVPRWPWEGRLAILLLGQSLEQVLLKQHL